MSAQFFDDPRWLAPPRVVKTDIGNGSFVLRSPEPLRAPARAVGVWLERWAAADARCTVPSRRARRHRRVAPAELSQRAQVGRSRKACSTRDARRPPVVILSDNGIDHALLALAAMHVGRPACAVTPAYSRMTQDHGKLARSSARCGRR